jgi:hypothetical protein
MGRAWRGASLLLIAAHGDCHGNAARGQGQPALNQSIAMGNGDGGAQSINCNGALGHGHWGRSNRRQEEWGKRSNVPIAMFDRVDVGVGCGAGAWASVIPCFLFEMLVNAQMQVRLKE